MWRFIGFVSRPVQYNDAAPFDDISNDHFRFSTLRVERKVFGDNELSAYYSRYELDNAKYLDAVGNERRDVFDARFAGKRDALDWDLESMGQTGSVGASEIRAWAGGPPASATAFQMSRGCRGSEFSSMRLREMTIPATASWRRSIRYSPTATISRSPALPAIPIWST